MELLSQVLARLPGRFATELGIDVQAGPAARQKWFLAAVLYGARISGQLAARTYQVFAARGIYTPEAILAQGWDNLVALLDAGGYARYDFKTATKLLKIMASLEDQYQGSLERLHEVAADGPDLEQRLQKLAPGVGPTTANIFLRELRGVWAKANPPLSPLAQLAGEHLGLLPPGLSPGEALATLEAEWQQQPVPSHDFADLEAALVRLGRDYCRKDASGPPCPLGTYCGRG
jgi:endonuclease III